MHVQVNSKHDKIVTVSIQRGEQVTVKLGTILFTFFTPTLRVEEGEKHESECAD